MRPPKKPEPDAIEVIDVGEDCYIEISKKHNAYTYGIEGFSGKYINNLTYSPKTVTILR